jgi:uncharacterized protein
MPNASSGSVKVFYPRFSRDELIGRLRAAAGELAGQLPLRQLVLFGSYAAGRQTVASDVDVLIVYEGEPRPDSFMLAKRILGIPGLEPHVYAEGEAEMLRDTLQRMTRSGVQIYPAATVEHERPGLPSTS